MDKASATQWAHFSLNKQSIINNMKKTKEQIATEHKLVNSEREAEAAMILFACILGGVILILLAIAMG